LLRFSSEQGQAPGDEAVLHFQPPPENQVAAQQRQHLRQPRPRTVHVTSVHAPLGDVLQGGDAELHAPMMRRQFQRRAVLVECCLPGAQVAQHPASEVHRPAGEARYLAAFHFSGVTGERGERERRSTCQRVRVPGEQERVQSGRGVLHTHLPTGRRAQQ
jgi:hypothetical protein